jgi:hypothetical protein
MSTDWYQNIGPQLVKTMGILAFMPYVGFVSTIVIRQGKIFFDSGWICCPNKKPITDDEAGEDLRL